MDCTQRNPTQLWNIKMKVLGNIDLDESGKINNAIVASGTTFPSPQESTIGELFFNTSVNSYGLFYYDGDSWELIVGNKESNKRFTAFKSSDLTWINVKNKPVDDDGKIDASQISSGTINAARLPSISWSLLTGKPATVAGYGITDAATKSHSHPEYLTSVPTHTHPEYLTSVPTENVISGSFGNLVFDSSGRLSAGKQVQLITVPQLLGTTIIPYDNTVPLTTEGTQLLSTQYSPSSQTATVKLSTVLTVESNTSSRYIVVSLFRDSTCVGVRAQLLPTANASFQMPICFYDVPGSTVTYTIRVGAHNTASWKINKNDGTTGAFGGVGQMTKYLKITEI